MIIRKIVSASVIVLGLAACEDTGHTSRLEEKRDVATEVPVTESPEKEEKKPEPEIEETTPTQDKPDFSSYADANEKKKAFFDFLRPAVVIENNRILKERQYLLAMSNKLQSSTPVSEKDTSYARRLGKLYHNEVPSEGVTRSWLDTMLVQVDVIPEALVLSQAANESGWGTSRFAVQGNNYFGQWCYRKGCGLVPSSRTEGASHEVAVFESAYQSVHAYFMNVNRNAAYKELREIRLALHDDENTEEKLSSDQIASQLTAGLSRYSERGEEYVSEIQAMIRHNNKYWSKG
ncbi:glucosaminidase domain-containing protein [Vibrio sp. Of7-15]|uniref:glucosaminidase domain-containing protein n=1 Tax=Vibrio sp. Of7-15 TaxID=2724879 RepID=UPI001EF1C505|nr:glucosaminidase domain-containing protein [Vibrio sp. Of7-15]MCG7496348.1 glucosaminidase domain-containing protein [Vibrio sp. Of7-15]